MVYPGYMLNPGDLFQVDTERVMHATGAPKEAAQRREGRRLRKGITQADKSENTAPTEKAPSSTEGEPALDSRNALQELLSTAKIITAKDKDASAKRKRALRSFNKLVRSTLSRTGSGASQDGPAASVSEQLQQLMRELNIRVEDPPQYQRRDGKSLSSASETQASEATLSAAEAEAASTPSNIDPATGRLRSAVPLGETQTVRSHQRAQLEAALQEARDNPVDPTKPYATPWQPRPWMSAFAFVPRYLEVHPSICSAVYLRHPVARPGLAEVPTPFDAELMSLSQNWYLRQR